MVSHFLNSLPIDMTMARKIRSRLLYYYAVLAVLVGLLQHSSNVAEAAKLHELDFVVPLTDETFEHETQASTGQTTGSWLLWFYNDKMAHHEHKDVLGQAPPASDGGDTIFSEHHIVVGSVGIKKSPRTHQRFGIKPRDLPALIFIHKGKFYRHPKFVRSPEEETYRFSWNSIVQFALQMGGHHSIAASHTTPKEENGADGEGEGKVGNEEATAEADENFSNVQGLEIPNPTNDWDDYMAMINVMFTECPNQVFIMLGLVLSAAAGVWMTKKSPKKEVTMKKKKS